MNKKALAAIPLLAALALAGCRGSGGTSASSAKAIATSTAAQNAKRAGSDILATCLPKSQQTKAELISLATGGKAPLEKLAKQCGIPKANRVPFIKAVAASALNAYFKGDFKKSSGRQQWADKVFPVIVKSYR